MTLPDICPKDGVSHCKTSACHLYVVDWRSGDEQCIIGYRSTHKKSSSSCSVEDTYAESTRRRTGRDIGHMIVDHPSRAERPERSEYIQTSPVPENPNRVKEPEVREKVVVKNKDTMVFESTGDTKEDPVDKKKRKTIDDVMDLDLPEDYEEKFWK